MEGLQGLDTDEGWEEMVQKKQKAKDELQLLLAGMEGFSLEIGCV